MKKLLYISIIAAGIFTGGCINITVPEKVEVKSSGKRSDQVHNYVDLGRKVGGEYYKPIKPKD